MFDIHGRFAIDLWMSGLWTFGLLGERARFCCHSAQSWIHCGIRGELTVVLELDWILDAPGSL